MKRKEKFNCLSVVWVPLYKKRSSQRKKTEWEG